MPVRGERQAFARTVLAEAPDAPGVYALFENDDVIFYGSAFGGMITIRSSLGEHFFGLPAAARQSATHCAWEISLSPAARARELLQEFQELFGRLPRLNGKADA